MNGFEISNDDIDNVLARYGVVLAPGALEDAYDQVDADAVARVALSVDIAEGEDDEDVLARQTDAAYDDIAAQLVERGIIPLQAVVKAGNKGLLDYLRCRGVAVPA